MAEVSLYITMAKKILNYIRENFTAGEFLPSERELSKYFNVSRSTIRLALNELKRLGVVKTLPKKGTVVINVDDTVINLNTMYSFSDEMTLLGKTPESKVIAQDIKLFEEKETEEFRQLNGQEVFYLERLRLGDNSPMMIDETNIPYEATTGIEEYDFNVCSLYNILEIEYKHQLSRAEETVFAAIADDHQAELLEIAKGSPVLRIFRISYNINNQPIEYTRSTVRADKFKYNTIHYNDQVRMNQLTNR